MAVTITASSDAEEVDNTIVDIDEIQAHGISAADITKLKMNNIHTVGMLVGTSTRRLVRIKGITEQKVEKMKEAAKKVAAPGTGGTFITAAELGHVRKKCLRISTGSKQLDACLNGGFQTMSISEVYGEFSASGCGKTQLAHTMAVIAQLPKELGGADGKVAYIGRQQFLPRPQIQKGPFDQKESQRLLRDSEVRRPCSHSFRHILTRPVDPEQACENIVYARAQNTEMQQEMLEGLAQSFATNEYRLLIVDSIMALFRTDYIGRGELSDRQCALNQFLRKATQMAEEFNLVVLMTNQVMSDPGASALFAGVDGRKPAGGHVLAHASTTRILLRKGRGEERVAKVVDSPDCPEAEATYIITNGGINDPEKA
ncbi:Dmc1p protein [Rutstroemia sp. NJR-2017a WRK4]|nr:Dmc1p protein [Rutstroemia sp. NJR-2017a WRK4]